MEALVVYWSATGNTEKVALAIQERLEAAGAGVTLKRVEDAGDADFYAYAWCALVFHRTTGALPGRWQSSCTGSSDSTSERDA